MTLAWQDIWVAMGLLLVFEGIMPFLNPKKWRMTMRLICEQPDGGLRVMGLISMMVGLIIIFFVRG